METNPKEFKTKVVHTLPAFLKDSMQLTWKEMGELFSERLSAKGYKANVSPANARNFSTGENTSWWFWGECGQLGLALWENGRENARNPTDVYNSDIFYAGIFSEDLRQVYSYYYGVKDLKEALAKEKVGEDFETSLESVLSSSDAIMNTVINREQDFFKVVFPSVED